MEVKIDEIIIYSMWAQRMSLTQVTVMEVKIDEIIICSMWSLRMSNTQVHVTVMEVNIDEKNYPMWSQKMFQIQVFVMEVKIDGIVIYSMLSLKMSQTQVTVIAVNVRKTSCRASRQPESFVNVECRLILYLY